MQDQIDAAFAAAEKAVAEAKITAGADRFPCGFAWVQIPDGRSPLAKALKAHPKGSKHWSKGVCVWNPGSSDWQNMDVAEAGARAFAAALPTGAALASSRMD